MGLAADLDNAKHKISFGNIAVETIQNEIQRKNTGMLENHG